MTRRFVISAKALAGLALCLATAAAVGQASAATKPAGDLVPRGATVLYWQAPSTGGLPSSLDGARLVVTKPSVIAAVRSLINSLPASSPPRGACPDDMMIPTTVSFAASTGSTPFTRVVFQLGGCPYARVYQRGVAVSPTLGGTALPRVYSRIRSLVVASAG